MPPTGSGLMPAVRATCACIVTQTRARCQRYETCSSLMPAVRATWKAGRVTVASYAGTAAASRMVTAAARATAAASVSWSIRAETEAPS